MLFIIVWVLTIHFSQKSAGLDQITGKKQFKLTLLTLQWIRV